MEEVDVPSYFLCPISLQIMRDPVTLPTGITYDRQSIERWLFSDKHSTCPTTNQRIQPDADLTPNHTLRRLIQSWCATNSGKGVERLPTPRAPVGKAVIRQILDDVGKPQLQAQSLRRLKDLVVGSDRNKWWAEGAGAAEVLVSVIRRSVSNMAAEESRLACGEALNVLHSLQPSDDSLRHLMLRDENLVGVLTQVLQQSDYQSRAYATFLLQSIFKTLSPVRLAAFDYRLFVELVKVLDDHISDNATKAALRALGELCPWGRNRVQAAEAGAVRVLIELLLDAPEKRPCEMIMIVLEQLCGCAEGRQELIRHGAGMAVVAKKIGRVSATVSDKGVRILHAVAKFSGTPALVQEMLRLGVVSKLCLVLHEDCGQKTKERAKEMLRLHWRAWKKSPCIAPHIHSLFS